MNHALAYYSGPWTDRQLKHLLSRVLFGVTKENHDFFKGKSMAECLDILLKPSSLPPPPSIKTDDSEIMDGKSFVFLPKSADNESGRTLMVKAWWVDQMLSQNLSITEKMVLFWHNHFVVEFDKTVKDSRYAYQYLCLLRQNALGNVKKLTREITTTPAMLVYLNGNENNKAATNENYARELQELFTVGKGPDSLYTEDDVKAMAKILSGWKDDEDKITSYFSPDFHNEENKELSGFYGNRTIKGRKGEAGARETDELVEYIFTNPEVSKFLCRKLYRWFVHFNIDEKVEEKVITPLAKIMVQSNYEMAPVLKALFASEIFYDPYLIGGMFKSPTDYLIGLLRTMKVEFSQDDGNAKRYSELWAIAVTLGLLGQDLGDPPNVAGWPAYYEEPYYYKVWINTENLTYRNKLARLLSYPEESDKLLIIDFIGFVSAFSNPYNAQELLADILGLLCVVQPGEKKRAYMLARLNEDGKWAEAWTALEKKPDDDILKKQIVDRLRRLFDVIFTMPEIQVM